MASKSVKSADASQEPKPQDEAVSDGEAAGPGADAAQAATTLPGDAAAAARRLEAEGLMKSYVIATMASGFVPVPVVDLVAVVGLQLKMAHRLCAIYGVPFSAKAARSIILSLLSGIVPLTVGTGLASLVKSVPGMGTFLGAASISIIGGGATFAVGQVFIQHFESGGTLFDLKARDLRTFFSRQFAKGKAFARTLRRDQSKGEAAPVAEPATAAAASS